MIDEPKPLTLRLIFGVETRTLLQLFFETFGALFLLILIASYLREPWIHLRPGSPEQILAELAPIVPIWLIFLAFIRHYFRLDEYQRPKFLQTVSLSAGLLVFAYWSYPYAQKALGLPPPPELMTWPLTVTIMLVTTWLSRHRKAV